jgi:hypothetical protein
MTTTRMKQPKPFAKETDTYSAFLSVVSEARPAMSECIDFREGD